MWGDTLPQGVPMPEGIGGREIGDMMRKPQSGSHHIPGSLIGAGAIGLALAEGLSSRHESVFPVEFCFGSSG